jgi:hypothetical protein
MSCPMTGSSALDRYISQILIDIYTTLILQKCCIPDYEPSKNSLTILQLPAVTTFPLMAICSAM